MSQKKESTTLFLVFVIIYVIASIGMLIFLLTRERPEEIVPILGLPQTIHFIVFYFVFPPILTIAAVIFFPRLLTPLIFKSKKIVFRKYNDAYVEVSVNVFAAKKFILRFIYIFLLTLGFLAIVIPLLSNQAAEMLNAPSNVESYEDEGLDLRFALPTVFAVTFTFVFPIVLGLWSVGWALEDSGLIHYSGLEGQKQRRDKLFEIEPIHLRYNGYLKGYAGISSVVFLISLAVYFAGFEGRAEDVMMVTLIPLFSIVNAIPAYLIYGLTKGKFKYLRKELPEAKRLAESELIQ
ncbi:MAG: hypothetical protein EU539_03185 [Promethearchaeota archaeon]|nr:MAG: hypothetical protein EU539_03185 [Candidatus Lokiarchaeota archaeon]